MQETIEVKKPSGYQMLKIKISRVAIRAIPVSVVLGVLGVGNAAALNNTSFSGVTDTIEAVVPIFTSLTHLVVAVVPYIICLTLFGGLVFFIKMLISDNKML